MKYATAVYGDEMIRSSEINLGRSNSRYTTNSIDDSNFIRTFFNPTTAKQQQQQQQQSDQYMKDRISQHCSIPVSDIIHLDIDHDGDVSISYVQISLLGNKGQLIWFFFLQNSFLQ
jgi:hypothetical protein